MRERMCVREREIDFLLLLPLPPATPASLCTGRGPSTPCSGAAAVSAVAAGLTREQQHSWGHSSTSAPRR